jgi:iron-sulfur cluster insertion protein
MKMSELAAPGLELDITESCAKRVAEIIAQEGNDRLMLRIAISGGGCSGFQYGFELDETVNDDDQVFERDGVKVVVDLMSLGMLAGSKIDFVDDTIGAAFSISNPNASSSCGCGSSFAI